MARGQTASTPDSGRGCGCGCECGGCFFTRLPTCVVSAAKTSPQTHHSPPRPLFHELDLGYLIFSGPWKSSRNDKLGTVVCCCKKLSQTLGLKTKGKNSLIVRESESPAVLRAWARLSWSWTSSPRHLPPLVGSASCSADEKGTSRGHTPRTITFQASGDITLAAAPVGQAGHKGSPCSDGAARRHLWAEDLHSHSLQGQGSREGLRVAGFAIYHLSLPTTAVHPNVMFTTLSRCPFVSLTATTQAA